MSFFMFFLHCALWYITQTNEMHNFLNYYLVFCLLHILKLVDSSSGRQLYLQYSMFYMHRCEQSGVGECVQTHSPAPDCRRQQKLNINSENCAFRWFVLYDWNVSCTQHLKVLATIPPPPPSSKYLALPVMCYCEFPLLLLSAAVRARVRM